MTTGVPTVGTSAGDQELLLALLSSRVAGGPRHAARRLLHSGRLQLLALVEQLPESDLAGARETAARLRNSGVRALLCDDSRYPDLLRRFPGAPPALFCQGSIELLNTRSVGVCGSRSASDDGLRAARACGQDAAELGFAVVSGYARGVDTASHLAALDSGGTTIAVLAEGIDHFRLKKAYRELSAAEGVEHRMLILSQFPPAQRWTAGAAMTRNQVIVGLSQALVVIEARETGGTLKAGEIALRGKRRVLVLGGSHGTPGGNGQLIAAGARQVVNRMKLADELRRLRAEEASVLPFD